MNFSTKEDIDAPIGVVFQRITDFDQFERQALRRGASVRRLSTGVPDVGTAWDIAFTFRGKERRLRAEIKEIDPPNALVVESLGSGIVGVMRADLVALSPKRTRLTVQIDLSAKTLPSRLLLQSFKLARGALEKRLKKRVSSFAADVSDKNRY